MRGCFRWYVGQVERTCEKKGLEVILWVANMKYYDEVTWKNSDPALVQCRERAELERFKRMGVYGYVSHDDVAHSPEGKVLKAKWARVKKTVVINQKHDAGWWRRHPGVENGWAKPSSGFRAKR